MSTEDPAKAELLAPISQPEVAQKPSSSTPLARLRTFGRPPRIMGVDVARAIAIFGMVGAHVGNTETLVWSDRSTWSGLVDGRSSILFALLAGVSLALASGGQETPTGESLRRARLRTIGRALIILLIGLLLEFAGTNLAVILPTYGVLFLIMTAMLGWNRRKLVITAVIVALIGPTAVELLSALGLGSGGPGLALLNGLYPAMVWIPMMLAGLAIGRSNLASGRTGVLLLVMGLLLAPIGYIGGDWVEDAIVAMDDTSGGSSGSGAVFATPIALPGEDVDLSDTSCEIYSDGWIVCSPQTQGSQIEIVEEDPTTEPYVERVQDAITLERMSYTAWSVEPHSGGTFEAIGSGGFALAVLGLCLLIARPLRYLLLPVAAVGSMPFTAYTFHALSVAIMYQPVGMIGIYDLGTDSTVWVVTILVMLVACTLWALLLGRGPLEQLAARAARAMDSA